MKHGSKPKLLGRLNRIAGQVRGVARMIEEDRYCIDVLTQTQAIRAALPDTPVAVVPYPQPLYNTASCGAIALTVHERAFIRQFLISLDQVIEWDAELAHFYYMGQMENALAGQTLQLCDPKNQGGYGINFVSPESVGGLPDQLFGHPLGLRVAAAQPGSRAAR